MEIRREEVTKGASGALISLKRAREEAKGEGSAKKRSLNIKIDQNKKKKQSALDWLGKRDSSQERVANDNIPITDKRAYSPDRSTNVPTEIETPSPPRSIKITKITDKSTPERRRDVREFENPEEESLAASDEITQRSEEDSPSILEEDSPITIHDDTEQQTDIHETDQETNNLERRNLIENQNNDGDSHLNILEQNILDTQLIEDIRADYSVDPDTGHLDLSKPPINMRIQRMDIADVMEFDTEIPTEIDPNGWVSDDTTGEEDDVIVEVPRDLGERLIQLRKTDYKHVEFQVHIVGKRRKEGRKTILTIIEMIIPLQKGSYRTCKLLDVDFLNKIEHTQLIGMIHSHVDGSGVYLSGPDVHTAAEFNHLYCQGDHFFSAVYDPKKNNLGFMKIKSSKLRLAMKCSQLTVSEKVNTVHDHPEAWAMVKSVQIDFDVIVTDLRKTPEYNLDSHVGGSCELERLGLTRCLDVDGYSRLTERDILDLHGFSDNATFDEFIEADTYETDKIPGDVTLLQPGRKHDDAAHITKGCCQPLEVILTVDNTGQTKSGTLLQPRGNINPLDGEHNDSINPNRDSVEEQLRKTTKLLKQTQLSNMNLENTLKRHVEKKSVLDSVNIVDNKEEFLRKIESIVNGVKLQNQTAPPQNLDWLSGFIRSFKENEKGIEYLIMWFAKTFDYLNFCAKCSKLPRSARLSIDSDTSSASFSETSAAHPTFASDQISILSWNMDGHSNKKHLLADILKKLCPNLLLLQETMLNVSSKPHFESFFREYKFVSVTSDRAASFRTVDLWGDRMRGGLAIGWRVDMDFRVRNVGGETDNLIGILLDLGSESCVLIICVYMPTYGHTKDFTDALESIEQMIIKNQKDITYTYIIGDLNENDKSQKDRKDEFRAWRDRLGLRRIDPDLPTHRHKVTKHESVLDGVITDFPAEVNVITITEEILDLTIESDHRPIMTTLPVTSDDIQEVKLDYEEYQGNKWELKEDKIPEVNRTISNWWKQLENIPRNSRDTRLRYMMVTMVQAFNEVMPKKKSQPLKGVYKLTKERKLQKTLREDKFMPDIEKMMLRDEIQKIRVERKAKEVEYIKKKATKADGEIYKLVDNLKEKSSGIPSKMKIGEKIYTGDAAKLAVIDYYQSQGDPSNEIFHQGFDQEELAACQEVIKSFMADERVKNFRFEPVTLSELLKVVDSFDSNVASDIRGASHHHLKLLDLDNMRTYLEWINELLESKSFYCPEMMMARFSILFKNRGSKMDLDNYRGIKVASITGRVVQRIMLWRNISDFVNSTIEDCQNGFVPRKGYDFGLAQVNCLLLEHEHEGRTMAAATMDIKKMFPRVSLSVAINEILTRAGDIADVIYLVMSCFGKSAVLKDGNKLYSNNPVYDEGGCREGELISPECAKLVQSVMSRAVDKSGFGVSEKGAHYDPEKKAYIITERKRPLCLLADDSFPMEETCIGLKYLLEGIFDIAKTSRVTVNASKTHVFFYGRDAEKMKKEWEEMFERGEVKVKAVDQITYLGATFGQHSNDLRNVEEKIVSSRTSMRMIAACGLNASLLMPLKERLQLVNSFVISRLIAGLNSFVLTGPAEAALKAAGEQLVRNVTQTHSKGSAPALFLLTGMTPLQLLFRIQCVNLLLRTLAVDCPLKEIMIFQFLHQSRYKYNWVSQVLRILRAGGIKSPERLFEANNVTDQNAKEVYRIIKRKLLQTEFERNVKKVLKQKRPCMLDLQRLAPGRGLISLRIEGLCTPGLIGAQVQCWILSGNYCWDSRRGKTTSCHAKYCEKGQDDLKHFFNCPKNQGVIALKREICEMLPQNHPLCGTHNIFSPLWTWFAADCFSSNLAQAQLRSDRLGIAIAGKLRILAFRAHTFRTQCRKKRLEEGFYDFWSIGKLLYRGTLINNVNFTFTYIFSKRFSCCIKDTLRTFLETYIFHLNITLIVHYFNRSYDLSYIVTSKKSVNRDRGVPVTNILLGCDGEKKAEIQTRNLLNIKLYKKENSSFTREMAQQIGKICNVASSSYLDSSILLDSITTFHTTLIPQCPSPCPSANCPLSDTSRPPPTPSAHFSTSHSRSCTPSPCPAPSTPCSCPSPLPTSTSYTIKLSYPVSPITSLKIEILSIQILITLVSPATQHKSSIRGYHNDYLDWIQRLFEILHIFRVTHLVTNILGPIISIEIHVLEVGKLGAGGTVEPVSGQDTTLNIREEVLTQLVRIMELEGSGEQYLVAGFHDRLLVLEHVQNGEFVKLSHLLSLDTGHPGRRARDIGTPHHHDSSVLHHDRRLLARELSLDIGPGVSLHVSGNVIIGNFYPAGIHNPLFPWTSEDALEVILINTKRNIALDSFSFGLTFTMHSEETESMVEACQYHSLNPTEAVGPCHSLKEPQKLGSHVIAKVFKGDVLCSGKELRHVIDLRPSPMVASVTSLHSVMSRREIGDPIKIEQFYIYGDASSSSLEAELSITANQDPDKEISTRSVYTYGYLYYI